MNFNVEQIIQWIDIGLLVAFFVVLGFLLLAFFRGLLRGWKQGTYRLIFLGIFIAAAIALSGIICNALGNIDISGWVKPFTITMGENSFVCQTGSAFDTAYNFVYGLLHDIYHVKSSPEAIANYSIAVAISVIRLVYIFLVGLLTVILIDPFSWLLWHLIFKRFTPKPRRKPRMRWISGLQEIVTTAVIWVLLVTPFTGIANAIKNNGEIPNVENNEYTSFVNRVLDTYDNSLFNKVFFSWTKGSGRDTIDTQFIEFMSQSSLTRDGMEYQANIVKEVRVVASVEGELIRSLLGSTPEQGAASSLLHTSLLIGESLYSLARSQNDLMGAFLPLALDASGKMDAIEKELGEDYVNYLINMPAEAEENLPEFERAFDIVAESPLLSTVSDPMIGNAYTPMYDGCERLILKDNVKRGLAKLEENHSDRELFNRLLSGFAYSQVKNNPAWNSYVDDEGMYAFLPKDKQGNVDLASLARIDWQKETAVLSSVSSSLGQIRRAESGGMDSNVQQLIKTFIDAAVENVDKILEILVGKRTAEGEPIVDSKGNNQGMLCLLDSDLIATFLPAVLEVGGTYLQENVLTDAEDEPIGDIVGNLAAALQGTSTKESRINFKRELGSILDVVGNVVSSDAGKEFLRDYENHPGITFTEEGQLIEFRPAIVEAIQGGVLAMDRSQLLTQLLPPVGGHFLRPLTAEGGALREWGIVALDTHCENLGSKLAEFLGAGSFCNDLIIAMGGLVGSTTTSFNVADLANAIVECESDESGHQLTRLLDLIIGSPLLNPRIKDGKVDPTGAMNVNFVGLLNSLFSKFGDQFDVHIEVSDLADVEMACEWDDNNHIVTPGENYYLVRSIINILDSSLLDNLSTISGGATAQTMSVLSELDIKALFSDIGASVVMRKIVAGLLDSMLLETLLTSEVNGQKVPNLDELGVSFSNLLSEDDWIQEGISMQALLDLVTRGIDVSQMDFLDPAVIELMERLSDSAIFNVPQVDAQGNIIRDEQGDPVCDYVFPDFLEQKLLISLDNPDVFRYFLDYGKDISGGLPTALEDREALCTVFVDTVLALDEKEQWHDEFVKLGIALRHVKALGNLDDLTHGITGDKVETIGKALDSIAATKLFGNVMLGNVLDMIIDSGSLPEFLRDANINSGWLFYNGEQTRDALVAGNDPSALIQTRRDQMKLVIKIMDATMNNEDLSTVKFATLDVENFLRPLLYNAYLSKLLNPMDPTDMYPGEPIPEETAFESIMTSIIDSSGVYHLDAENKIVRTNLTLKDVVQKVSDLGDWRIQIESLCVLVDSLQNSSFVNDAGDFDFDAISDLESFFRRSNGRQELAMVLKAMEDSELFYRAVPYLLDSAFEDAVNTVPEPYKSDLLLRDFYFAASATDFPPYTEAEVDGFIDFLANVSGSLEIDTSDLASLNSEALTSTIASMFESPFFHHTVDTTKNMTAAQAFLSDIVVNDSLEDYFFDAASPKDEAMVAEGNYTNAKTKASYMVKSKFPVGNNANVTPLIRGELKDVLDALGSDAFSSFIGGGSGVIDLSEEDMATLLHTLNDCYFYRDCVPNALKEALTNLASIDIEGVDMGAGDFYFSYYFYNPTTGRFSSTRQATPNWEMPFYEDEIDHLAALSATMQRESATLSAMSMSSIDALLLRNILIDLSDSYLFHLGNASHRNALSIETINDYGGTPGAKFYQFKDLTVFEQFIYKLMSDSTLASSCYNEKIDYALTFDDSKGTADKASWKLHDRILNFTANPASVGSRSASWLDEIEAFTTDGHHHAGTADDPYIGMIETVQKLDILSGDDLVVDNDLLLSFSPKKISALLYAINEVDLCNDLLPNSMNAMLGTASDGTGFGTDGYSSFEVTEIPVQPSDFQVPLASYIDGTTFHGVSSMTFHTIGSVGALNYQVTSLDDQYDFTPYCEAKVDTTDDTLWTIMTNDIPVAFKVRLTGTNVDGGVTSKINVAKFAIGQDGYANSGIPAITYLLSSAYRGETTPGRAIYFSFDSEGGSLNDFIDEAEKTDIHGNPLSNFDHSTYGLLGLFLSSGFYDMPLAWSAGEYSLSSTGTFRAGAFTFYNALSFTPEASLVAELNITLGGHYIDPEPIYLASHVGDGGADVETSMIAIDDVFLGKEISHNPEIYVTEAYWLDHYGVPAVTNQVYDTVSAALLQAGIDMANDTIPFAGIRIVDRVFADGDYFVDIASMVKNAVYDIVDFVIADEYAVSPAELTHIDVANTSAHLGMDIISGEFRDLSEQKNAMLYLNPGYPTSPLDNAHTTREGRIDAAALGHYLDFYGGALQAQNVRDEMSASILALNAASKTTMDSVNLAAYLPLMDGGHASLYVDKLYLADMYDYFVAANYFKVELVGMELTYTDFPYVNAPGKIANVDTPFSYANVASTIV